MEKDERRWVCLDEMLQNAQHADTHLRHEGKVVGVVVNIDRYHLLLDALEEIEDLRAFDEAMAEPGENIPWNELLSKRREA